MFKPTGIYEMYCKSINLYKDYIEFREKCHIDRLERTISRFEHAYNHCFSELKNLPDVVEEFGQENLELLEDFDGYRFKIMDRVEENEEIIYEIYEFLEDWLYLVDVTMVEKLVAMASVLILLDDYLAPETEGLISVRFDDHLFREDFERFLKRVSKKSLDEVIQECCSIWNVVKPQLTRLF